MDPQLQQLLQQLLSATNANTAHVTNAINTLNNRLGTLEQTVARNNNITESLSNETRRYNNNAHTQTRIDDALNHFEDTFKKALQAAGGKFVKKDGTLTKSAEDRVTRLVHGDKFRKHAEPILSAKVNAYDVAHPGNTRDFTDFREGAQLLRDALASFDDKSADSLKLSNAQRTRFYREANIGGRLTNKDRMEDHFVTRTDRSGNYEHLSVETSLSRARDELNDLSKEIIKTTQLLQLQNEETTKVNTALTNLANNSTMIDNMLQGLKTTADTASGATLGFADMIDSVTNKPGRGLQLLNDNIGSTRDALKKLRASTNSITRANERAIKRLQDAGSGGIGSSNTFQEQARKNSDRARTAGFLALLIPELAKLLKKNNPVADLLKYGALRLGSGKSGMGDHPVMGAIAYGLSGVALTAITALLWRNPKTVAMLSRLSAPMLNSISKMTGGLTRNFGLFASAVRVGAKQGAQSGKFLGGVRGGLNTAVRLSRAYKLGTTANYATRKGLMGPFVNSGNVNLWRSRAYATGGKLYPSNLAANPGRVAELQMEKMGMKAAGYWRLPFGARYLKGIGAISKRLPLLGALVDQGFDMAQGRSWKKSLLSNGGAAALSMGLAGSTFGISLLLQPMFKNIIDVMTNNVNGVNGLAQAAKERWGKEYESLNTFERLLLAITDPVVNIWNWLKNFFHIKDTSTPGQNNGQGGIPVNEQNQFSWDQNKQKQQREEAKKKYEHDQRAFNELEKYIGGGNSNAGRDEYNRLANQYKREYAKKQLYGASSGQAQMYSAGSKKKQSDDEFIKSTMKSWEAQQYADAQMAKYRVNQKRSLAVRKQQVMNPDYIDPTQLISRQFLLSHDQAQVDRALSKLTGAYEGLRNGKNYSVSWGSFSTDAHYLGKGTQARLDSLLGQAGIHDAQVTSAMGTKNGPHAKGGAHYNILGNTVDITTRDPNAYRKLQALERQGAISGLINEYKYKQAGTTGGHYHFTVTGAAVDAKKAAAQVAPETPTLTGGVSMSDVKETASSEIRQTLAQLAGIAQNNSKQARTKSVIFSATDVTGSLGVWGITQMNNGVVNIGK